MKGQFGWLRHWSRFIGALVMLPGVSYADAEGLARDILGYLEASEGQFTVAADESAVNVLTSNSTFDMRKQFLSLTPPERGMKILKKSALRAYLKSKSDPQDFQKIVQLAVTLLSSFRSQLEKEADFVYWLSSLAVLNGADLTSVLKMQAELKEVPESWTKVWSVASDSTQTVEQRYRFLLDSPHPLLAVLFGLFIRSQGGTLSPEEEWSRSLLANGCDGRGPPDTVFEALEKGWLADLRESTMFLCRLNVPQGEDRDFLERTGQSGAAKEVAVDHMPHDAWKPLVTAEQKRALVSETIERLRRIYLSEDGGQYLEFKSAEQSGKFYTMREFVDPSGRKDSILEVSNHEATAVSRFENCNELIAAMPDDIRSISLRSSFAKVYCPSLTAPLLPTWLDGIEFHLSISFVFRPLSPEMLLKEATRVLEDAASRGTWSIRHSSNDTEQKKVSIWLPLTLSATPVEIELGLESAGGVTWATGWGDTQWKQKWSSISGIALTADYDSLDASFATVKAGRAVSVLRPSGTDLGMEFFLTLGRLMSLERASKANTSD